MIPTVGSTQAVLQAECVPYPNPLLVSTGSKTKNGVLRLTFSKPDGSPDIRCRAITITLPVGTAATDLTSNPQPIDANQDAGQGTWHINTRRTERAVTFTCTPEAPGNPPQVVFDAARRFTLSISAIPVARTPGHAPLTITATTAITDDWEDRTVSTPAVEKHLEDLSEFFFRSFSCEKPQVDNSSGASANDRKVTLRWEGSDAGTEYYLSWDDEPPRKVIGRSHQTHALTDTTTFVLDARTKSDNGQTVHHYLSTTVTVKNPDIRAKTLTATDKVSVAETFSADNKDGRKTWARATTFEGDVTIMANNKLAVGGALTVKGETDLNAHVRANAHVTVTGGNVLRTRHIRGLVNESLTIDEDKKGVRIDGALTTNGTIQANDNVTVHAGKTLKAANLEHPTGATSIAVKNSLAFTGKAGISIPKDGGQIAVYGALTAEAGAAAGEGRLTANGPLTANRTVTVTGQLSANGGATSGGQRVLRNNDTVSLKSPYFGNKYLNGSTRDTHKDHNGRSWPAAFYASFDNAAKFNIENR